MHTETILLGNQQIVVGPRYAPLSDGLALLQVGLKLELLPMVAEALEAAIASGVTMSTAQYHAALWQALTASNYRADATQLAALELEILKYELQQLRARGMTLPVQAFEEQPT